MLQNERLPPIGAIMLEDIFDNSMAREEYNRALWLGRCAILEVEFSTS